VTTEEQEQVISKTRMEALTDGVIAIVLTILVLELGGEAISQAKTEEDLTAALLAQWPVFLSYAVSFLVVGIFWVAHHTYFAFIPQVNETQLWLNLLFLFSVSLIPFSAALIGEHSDFRPGSVIYGLNMTAATATLHWNWQYAWTRKHIVVEDEEATVIGSFRKRTLRAAIAYLVATCIAWYNPRLGFFLYVAVAIVFAIAQIRRRTMERVLRRLR
jgi:uncharacterized membrane protein